MEKYQPPFSFRKTYPCTILPPLFFEFFNFLPPMEVIKIYLNLLKIYLSKRGENYAEPALKKLTS